MAAVCLCCCLNAWAAEQPAALEVNFEKRLQVWDGFGVNYVEACQTRDYARSPQEYGGFSVLSEEDRRRILDMTFGPDGLEPGLLKMFLDSWHQSEDGHFDHETTTKWMRYFAREGLARTRARGGDLQVITTLYGPPGWMTRQRFVRGRDLDPAHKEDCARYMIDWVKFLRAEEKLPVKYISFHNEGEDFSRWPVDGSTADRPSHDYNLFWPSAQVVDFLKFMRPMLHKEGLADVGLAPGETTNWYRFVMWGYATAIAADPEAVKNLGLITSHGFTGGRDVWFGNHTPMGNQLLRLSRPELHSWTTSMSWGKMDANFVEDIRGQIYKVQVNGVIPWAAVQTNRWTGGDPNPGTAFRVDVDAKTFAVLPGYYFYKQVTRAGRPGMHVCAVTSSEASLNLIAFTGAGTQHPDAFVVINTGETGRAAAIAIRGSAARAFEAFRTSTSERYQGIGRLDVEGGRLSYTAPPLSVTTFFAAR